MNERIQQLWTQAGEEIKAEYEDDSRRNRRLYNEIFLPKFAELIVRECMKESMDEIVADEDIAQEKDPLIREYLTGNNQGIVDAVVRFRNHFGVEE
jgi:hypothetical protein